jgi:hypothetical protein
MDHFNIGIRLFILLGRNGLISFFALFCREISIFVENRLELDEQWFGTKDQKSITNNFQSQFKRNLQRSKCDGLSIKKRSWSIRGFVA